MTTHQVKTPWWKKEKYGYNKQDMISLRKIRPGISLKKMDCRHPNDALTWSSYLLMLKTAKKKLPVWYSPEAKAWYLSENLVCPICQTKIPYEEPRKGKNINSDNNT